MRRALPALLLCVAGLLGAIAGCPAAAERQDRLLDPREAEVFRGIGRLNFAGSRFCSAALVSPREVVTAAHCLFNPRTGAPVPVSEMRFVAGLYRGDYAAVRDIDAVAIPLDFALETDRPNRSLQRDFALVRLAEPVDTAHISPLAVGGADLPEHLSIVGYSRERAQAPSVVEPCRAVAHVGLVFTLTCRITFGASGAPVLETVAGVPRIFAVVTAIGQKHLDRHVATYVVRIDAAVLDNLRQQMTGPAARVAP